MKWIAVLVCTFASSTGTAETEAYFSPHGGARQAILRELASAKRGDVVLVQAYGFTSIEIAEALVQAAARGAQVELLLDKENLHDGHSQAGYCASRGIVVRIDPRHPIAHAKVIILVGKEVIAGSYNFTAQSERNSEDLLLLRDPSLAAKFADNWHRHEQHSQPLLPDESTPYQKAAARRSSRSAASARDL
jgi:phosphatidylserine/phosphatidylglycerophosphate/cardiolipin synthase-like enzyme